jgi:integrase
MMKPSSIRKHSTASSAFAVKPFKNRNGAISWRVSGWLLGERIRKNFKTREEAILERGALFMKQAQADSNLRMTSTFLSEAQLREAEAAFLKTKESPRPLMFYLDYGLENYREPKTCLPVADAVTEYLAARSKDVEQGLICQRQHDAIRRDLAVLQTAFEQRTLDELTTEKLLDFIRRGAPSLKTQNNRRAHLFTFFKHACRQSWLVKNPLENTIRHRVDHARGSAPSLNAAQAAKLMAHVETVENGAFVPYFALCLFAGIRPDGEISKLSVTDVCLENESITIEPWVSKVNMRRLVAIQPNLAAWLRAYPLDEYPVIPPKDKMKNVVGKIGRIRRQFKLSHDVLRHTFISMHVAKYRSMGDAALQAGNSETIIRRHYLNVTTSQEAEMFFAILPRKKHRKRKP